MMMEWGLGWTWTWIWGLRTLGLERECEEERLGI